MIVLVVARLAKRWAWVLPVWVVAEYLVAPAVVGVLAPIVWDDLWPKLQAVMEAMS
jgi:hypothetical protein